MLKRDLASREARQLGLAVQGGHAHLRRTGCTASGHLSYLTFTDLTMLSANSSALASASGLIFALNEAALARAEPDLAPAVSRAGDLVRLLERATRTIDLCGLCGILRVVLQILSMNPGAQCNVNTGHSHVL